MIGESEPVLLSFGEVLWDIIEGQRHLGGAPFNLAAHAARLGLSSWLISAVGDDELGREVLTAAARFGVHTEAVALDPVHPTGTVTVALSPQGQPEYTIHSPVAWDFLPYSPETLRRVGVTPASVDIICFGTLAQRSPGSRAALEQLLEDYSATPAFFDVNLRAPDVPRRLIEAGLLRASIVKVNDVEARRLAEMLQIADAPLDIIAPTLRDRYAIDVLLVTRGADGCLVADDNGTAHVPGRAVTVVDAVGAGDAFSAAFLAAYLGGKSPVAAAAAGNRRGAFVATQRGAVPERGEDEETTDNV